MKRLLAAAVAATLSCTITGWAQDSVGSGLADRSPQENASGAAIQERAPGTWVNAARARHALLIQARVNNPRNNLPAGTTEGLFSEATSGTTGGLTSVLDLIDQFGGVSGISDILGSLSGTNGSLGGTTGSGGSSTSTGGSSNSTGGATIEDLLQLRDQLLGNDKSGTSKESDTSQAYDTREGSGAIGRLPKIEQRAQDQTQERKFVARFAERMAQTVFTALALGFQSQAFIDFVKNAVRPVLFPATESTGQASDTGNSSGGTDNSGDSGNSGGDASSGGSSDSGGDTGSGGSGLEDINPPGDNSGDNGSIV